MAVDRTSGTVVTREYSIGRSVLYGVVAGIIAGIVFGLMMQIMTPDMMNAMIGQIIGQPNPMGSWLYHLFNSAVIGAIFGLALGRFATNYGTGAILGAVYGFVWWILGPLILMPLLLGMNEMVFAINNTALLSLVGHLVYGVITGVVYIFLRDRF
jgi:uncharacterized membrane protein YagU involved in acid resistance